MVDHKRLDLFLESARRTRDLWGGLLRIAVVGDGPCRDAGVRLSAELDLNATFTGFLPRSEDVYGYMKSSRIVVLTGEIEGWGLTAVEALACGTPVAAVGRGGVLDVVVDGVHGALYPEEEGVDGLSAAIDKTRLIRSNQANLRRRAELFSAQRFSELLSSLLTRKPS